MIIERAVASDLEEILALQKKAYISEAEIYSNFNIPPLVQTFEEIKDEFRNQVFLKALESRRIVGSARAYQDEKICYIGKLFVEPACQNQGIGASLLNNIEEVFKFSKRYELFTGDKSLKNIYLYQKLGYRIFKKEIIAGTVNFVYLEKDNDSGR